MSASASLKYISNDLQVPYYMLRVIAFLKRPVVYHILFWLIYFSFNVLRWGSYFDDYFYSLHSNLVEFPIHIILVYINLNYLLPRFIPSSYSKYFILLFLSIFVFTLLRIVLTYEFVTTEIYKESFRHEENIFDFNYILAAYIGELYVIGLTTSIKITMEWVQNQKRTRELEKRQFETELDFLKSQIQPHFFFNTLNNLHSLILNKSELASETVIKLSELMSYVIYKAGNRRVSIMDEIIHIQNYLDLEKLRYGNRLDITFNLSGSLEGKTIAPLILLPFIENSFKHGVNNKLNEIPIEIDISADDHYLTFWVENLKNKNGDNNSILNHSENKGIGLKNTERRLNLLYNGDYQLDIVEDAEKYKVILKVPIFS